LRKSIKDYLDTRVDKYNRQSFIPSDPISVPHQFNSLQDIEIAGFFAAIFSWGKRSVIIQKANELMDRMDREPHRFVTEANDQDLKSLLGFKHRTFNDTDLLYLIDFLGNYYRKNSSLESLFCSEDIQSGLINFHNAVFDSSHAPVRTKKHVATPVRKSACKRINMYLRWMVRKDERGVDFGVWKKISASTLMIPLDVHVQKVAMKIGLLSRTIADWQAVEELTAELRKLDANDPVKYDYALFSMGIEKEVVEPFGDIT